MSQCGGCKKKFPGHLIQPFVSTAGNQKLCPICALKTRNKLHGLPEGTPFHGEMAAMLYDEAVAHLERRKP